MQKYLSGGIFKKFSVALKTSFKLKAYIVNRAKKHRQSSR